MAQQQEATAAATRYQFARVWPQLLPELTERIVSCLHPNETACTFRLVNKAAAAQFRGPQHTRVRLWEPVPPHAFFWKWAAPGAMRHLTLARRRELLSLTAASGVIPNLEAAAAAAGCSLTLGILEAAATAGRLDVCRWLKMHGCPMGHLHRGFRLADAALAAAAKGGHQDVCEWLFTIGCRWTAHALENAARGGHLGLAEWLLQRRPRIHEDDPRMRLPWLRWRILAGAAEGCDLATLQRLWEEHTGPDEQDGEQQQHTQDGKSEVLHAAASSPRPDWSAKVEWLLVRGCALSAGLTWGPASLPDAFERLRWLRERGCPMDRDIAVVHAAWHGRTEALEYLLAETETDTSGLASVAAEAGHLGCLQALHAAGCEVTHALALQRAARNGHLHVVSWLVEAAGDTTELGASVFTAAAQSGSVELMAWLRERGCAWVGDTVKGAVESGCEAALEWLVEQGCPMQADGSLYTAALQQGDTLMLACLMRMGCPMGPHEADVKARLG